MKAKTVLGQIWDVLTAISAIWAFFLLGVVIFTLPFGLTVDMIGAVLCVLVVTVAIIKVYSNYHSDIEDLFDGLHFWKDK